MALPGHTAAANEAIEWILSKEGLVLSDLVDAVLKANRQKLASLGFFVPKDAWDYLTTRQVQKIMGIPIYPSHRWKVTSETDDVDVVYRACYLVHDQDIGTNRALIPFKDLKKGDLFSLKDFPVDGNKTFDEKGDAIYRALGAAEQSERRNVWSIVCTLEGVRVPATLIKGSRPVICTAGLDPED